MQRPILNLLQNLCLGGIESSRGSTIANVGRIENTAPFAIVEPRGFEPAQSQILNQVQYPWYEWLFDHPWAIELAVAILLLIFFNIVLKKILLRSKKLARLKDSDWRFHLDYAASAPARVLIWVLLIAFAIDLLVREVRGGGSFAYVPLLRNAAIVFCLAWFLLRWKKVLHRVLTAKGRMATDPFTVEVVSKIFTIAVVFIALLTGMSIFGLNIAPLIAFGGIGAAALGIGGKDAIANFFGGFMIYLTRPFTVGDQIELPQRKMIGNIEEIGWYSTTVRDLQKKPIYIPNSVFSTEPLINQSRMTHRRIEESIGIRYEDAAKIPKLTEEIRNLFERHGSIDHHQSIYVFLERFADSGIQIEIKAYVLCTRYEEFMDVRQEILSEIYRIIERLGAAVPYPTIKVLK